MNALEALDALSAAMTALIERLHLENARLRDERDLLAREVFRLRQVDWPARERP